MTDEKKFREPKAPGLQLGNPTPKITRRRFTKAGAVAPVIMTLGSRSVWGQTCSFSGQLSGNEYSTSAPYGVGHPPSYFAELDEKDKPVNLPDGITFETKIYKTVTDYGGTNCLAFFDDKVKFGDLLGPGVTVDDLALMPNAAAAVLNIVSGNYGYEMHGLMEFLCTAGLHPEAVEVLICLNNR